MPGAIAQPDNTAAIATVATSVTRRRSAFAMAPAPAPWTPCGACVELVVCASDLPHPAAVTRLAKRESLCTMVLPICMQIPLTYLFRHPNEQRTDSYSFTDTVCRVFDCFFDSRCGSTGIPPSSTHHY